MPLMYPTAALSRPVGLMNWIDLVSTFRGVKDKAQRVQRQPGERTAGIASAPGTSAFCADSLIAGSTNSVAPQSNPIAHNRAAPNNGGGGLMCHLGQI